MSVLYTRMPRHFADLAIAHGDARYGRLLRSIARVKLLILDDWGPESLTPGQARDQPGSRRSLARYDWRPDARRRHSRPHRPQRLPGRTRRRKFAQAPNVTEIEALLTNPDNPNIINFDLWKQAAGGRHQIGTLAGFRSEQVA